MVKKFFFLMAIVLQLFLLMWLPALQGSNLASGDTILLETEPYDPFTIFSGYYVDLRYTIASPAVLPGSSKLREFTDYYLVITKDARGIGQPVRLSIRYPRNLASGELVLKGRYRYGWMHYGIEWYYLPEEKRIILARVMNQGRNRVTVVIRIGKNGKAAILKLRVKNRVFLY